MTYKQKKEIIKNIIFLLLIVFGFVILRKMWIEAAILFGIIAFSIAYYITISKITETTLCLIVQNNKALMMLRNKKKNDVHVNKYNGLGGHLEKGESKVKCVLREVYEEAGIHLTNYQYVGNVVFLNFGYKKGKEVMYCFVGYEYVGEIGDCNEGDLEWVEVDNVMSLPLWEGDQYFLMNIILNKPFRAFLHYEDDHVINHKINMR